MNRCAKVVGISLRTLERWMNEDGGVDQRHGPRTVPGNKLSEREEQELLDVLTAPEHRGSSPAATLCAQRLPSGGATACLAGAGCLYASAPSASASSMRTSRGCCGYGHNSRTVAASLLSSSGIPG